MSTELAKVIANQPIHYGRTEHFRVIEEVMQLMPPREVWRPEFDALLDSIRDLGVLNPVVTVHSDDYLWVVDGVMRLAAARKLGISEIPYVILPYRHDDLAVVDLAARLNWSHRHLSTFEKVWVIGNHYLSEKNRHGGTAGNKNASKTRLKTELSFDNSVFANIGEVTKTAERLATLYHVGQVTVSRYANMAKVCRSIIRIMAEQLNLPEEKARIRFFDLWQDMENSKQINLRFLRMIADRLVEHQLIDDPDPVIRKAWLGYADAVDSYPRDSIAQHYTPAKLATDGVIEAIVAEVNKQLPSKKVLERINVQQIEPEQRAKSEPQTGEYIKAASTGLRAESSGERRGGYQFDIPPMPEDPPVVALIKERSQLLSNGINEMRKQLDDLLTAYVPQLTRLADDLIRLMEEHWQEDFNTFDRSTRPNWEEIAAFYRLTNIKKGIFVDTLESDRDAIHLLWSRLAKLAELAERGMPEVTKGLF
jgi:hypothetical protein